VATLTINTTPQQDQRLVAAFGTRLSLGRDATGSEIKAAMIDYLRRVVWEEERAAAQVSPPASFDPT
jgi:hypothetical protein